MNTEPVKWARARKVTRLRFGLTRGERSQLRTTVRLTVSKFTAQDAASGSDAGNMVMGPANTRL
jgi:hypothetical protein